VPVAVSHIDEEVQVVIIGIDPHKASHMAVAIDDNEMVLSELEVRASRQQQTRLLRWAARFEERTWAVESASGLGELLARELVDAGEHVIDVPATLAARVRLLGSGKSNKNDANDARSTAVAALRHPRLRTVNGDSSVTELRLLADRHHDLGRLRTQSVCRLHQVLCSLVAGGHRRRMSADQAERLLTTIRPTTQVEHTRTELALELVADVRRLDDAIELSRRRLCAAVRASGTSLTDIYGVGPVVAGIILGHVGDISRFPSSDHFASYNATAPIEASSGPRKRHRLNPRGNRTVNYALHMAAVTQIRNDTPGRAYYQRKLAEGKTTKEAMRALKRRISNVVYRQLQRDLNHR
jgi:transposase